MNKITRKKPNYKTIQYIGCITKYKCVGYYEKAFNLGYYISIFINDVYPISKRIRKDFFNE